MKQTATPFAPQAHANVLVTQLGKSETIVYDLTTDKAHCLNATASFVWQHCDGQTPVADIVRLFAQQQPAAHENLIWLALKQLDRAGLLAKPQTSTPRPAVTRRTVLRQLGRAAAVTLPVVASLAAPEAVRAGSCLLGGVTCSAPGDCCSGVCTNSACVGNSPPAPTPTLRPGKKTD